MAVVAGGVVGLNFPAAWIVDRAASPKSWQLKTKEMYRLIMTGSPEDAAFRGLGGDASGERRVSWSFSVHNTLFQ